MLKNEVTQLKQLLLTHKDCPITAMQKESQGYLSECYTLVPLLVPLLYISHKTIIDITF